MIVNQGVIFFLCVVALLQVVISREYQKRTSQNGNYIGLTVFFILALAVLALFTPVAFMLVFIFLFWFIGHLIVAFIYLYFLSAVLCYVLCHSSVPNTSVSAHFVLTYIS